MAFTKKNLEAYQRSTNPRYATGGKVKETPDQKLARYTSTYGAKGKKMFEDEALEEAKKVKVPFYRKETPNYEPAPAVKKTKAVLAAGSLANAGNPLGPLFSVAGATYDAGTAIKHAIAGDSKEAAEDAIQALVGIVPGLKGVKGLKGEQVLSKLEKLLNKGGKLAKAGSDAENIAEGFANGGTAGDPPRRRGRASGAAPAPAPTAPATQEVIPFLPLNDLRPGYTPEVGAEQVLTPTQAINPVDQEVHNWTRDYIESPKYKERLAKFYQYPDYIQRQRAAKASNVGFTEGEEGSTAYSDTGAYPNQLHIGKKQLRNLKAGRDEAAAHELGHLSNASETNKALHLNPLEENLIFNKNKTVTPELREMYQKTVKENKSNLSDYLGEGSTHDIAPSETMSDVQALRFFMNKYKIYDARTQDLTPEVLKKALKHPEIKKGFSTKRLLDNFEEKDLLEILNKVAVNKKMLDSNKGMAAFGGRFALGGAAGGGWNAAASALPAVGNLLETLINKPSIASTQPIMNAQTIHNMSNPYDSPGLKFAMGGEMGDVDDDQYFDWLEQLFDNTAQAEDDDEFINVEDETLEEGDDNDEGQMFDDSEGEDGYFATGGTAKKGIYIKPSKRGTFTAAAKKHGKSVQGFARQVLANKGNYSPAMVKKANFARNASKWKHAYGGWAGMAQAFAMGGTNKFNRYHYATGGNTPIEVEGEEIVELPDGQMQQMQGPSHEEGGIPMNVPQGTKIYSDRLNIEGQSMQERKSKRERQMKKLDAILAKNPTDALTKNTYKATKQAIDMEDAQDMELQNAANAIYSGQMPKRAMGGDIKYANGGTADGGPVDDYFANLLGYGDVQIPYAPGQQPSGAEPQMKAPFNSLNPELSTPVYRAPVSQPSTALQGKTPTLQTRNIPTASGAEQEYKPAAGLTTGDYIGLGANVFGAIAPILNTRNAAAARKPNLNRYLGVGKEALDANDLAQSLVGRGKANAQRDLDSSTGTAFARNRMGARGINTQRALDTATQIGRDKAAGQIEQTGNEQLMNLLGQRGQLTNWRDQMQAAGATERDVRDTQDIDNYYSNMAENLANFATQAGNIGRNLNISKGNKDNTALLEQMSEYFDFGRDKSGKLVLKNKKGK